MIAAAGSAAAISAIFGNPLVAAILFLEASGWRVARRCSSSCPAWCPSGVGALVFTGLGDWTGLEIGALAIPHLEAAHLVATDVRLVGSAGSRHAVATWAMSAVSAAGPPRPRGRGPFVVTVGAGLLAGGIAALYAVVTDHSPVEVALSGQVTLATLATDPGAWSTGALVMLLLCKGLAYSVCLGAFRGGPVFPAVFLGATFGHLASTSSPG